ncbi:MAG: hypothetical protein ACXAC2_00370 [Candidatus Kariarchaeaceae archaeon]|jgi:hypothetical protein
MASLEIYLYLGAVIVLGALIRNVEVFLYKYGWNWEQFRREELIYTTVYGAATSLIVGLGHEAIEFLGWGAIDFTKPYVWILFLAVGYLGQDQGHQARRKLKEMEDGSRPVITKVKKKSTD